MNCADKGPYLKVLVAYYSRSGNTGRVARTIRDRTCGVLYGLELANGYSGEDIEDRVQHELAHHHLPSLKGSIPPMAWYDLIFVGGPVWLGRLAPPVGSFLREVDFAGRTVAPFCTHGGEKGRWFEDFGRQVRNATLVEGLDMAAPGTVPDESGQGAVEAWVSRLGIPASDSVLLGYIADKLMGRGVFCPAKKGGWLQ